MKRLLIAVAVVMSISLTGCFWLVTGAAGGAAGTYAWMNGSLSRNYPQPMSTTWDATLHALGNLRLPVQSQEHDAFYGTIKARMLKHEEVMTVTVERWTDTETKVTVRAGTLGDRDISERVHEEISKSLK